MTPDERVEDFPYLPRDDIRACLAFAKLDLKVKRQHKRVHRLKDLRPEGERVEAIGLKADDEAICPSVEASLRRSPEALQDFQ